jgi:hypothetical protein
MVQGKSKLALRKFREMAAGDIISMCKNKGSEVVFMLERSGIEGTTDVGAVIHTFELKDGANLSEAKNFKSTLTLKTLIKSPQAIALSHDGESLYIYDNYSSSERYFIKIDMRHAYDITSIDPVTVADNIVMTRDGLNLDDSAKGNQQAFTQADAAPSWAALNADSTEFYFYDQKNNEIQTVPLYTAKAIHETGSGSLVTTADELLLSVSTEPTNATAATLTGLATTSSGDGTGAVLSIAMTANAVTAVTVTTIGSRYKVGDTLTVAKALIPGTGTNSKSDTDIVFTLLAGDLAALDAAVDLPAEITGDGNGLSVAFNSDNTAIFMIDYNYNLVKVTLSDGAFDFTTLGYTSSSDSFKFDHSNLRFANTFFMSDNGKKIYIHQRPLTEERIDPNIYEFEMNPAFDVTTLKQVTTEEKNYNPSLLVTNTFREVQITIGGKQVTINIPDTQVFKEGALPDEEKNDELLEILGNIQLMRAVYTQQKLKGGEIIDQPNDEIFKENLEKVLGPLGFNKEEIKTFINSGTTKRVLVDEEQGLVSDVFTM